MKSPYNECMQKQPHPLTLIEQPIVRECNSDKIWELWDLAVRMQDNTDNSGLTKI